MFVRDIRSKEEMILLVPQETEELVVLRCVVHLVSTMRRVLVSSPFTLLR